MLSDCTKCWNTPCDCGWDYKDYSVDQLAKFIADIVQYRDKHDALDAISLASRLVKEKTNFKEKQ